MLIDELEPIALLGQIVTGFTADPVLQADLMQEGLIHLWKVECEKRGQTRSWYLQSCRFHLQHWLASGRSVDSPKRANGNKRIVIEGDGEDPALCEYHTNGELFESVCFRDAVSTLALHLKPSEQVVLGGLSEGMRLGEIVSKSGLSHPTVLKYRRRIASLTKKLGICEGVLEGECNGCALAEARIASSGNNFGRPAIKAGPPARTPGKRSRQPRRPKASALR